MKKQFARVFSLMMISFFALGSVSGADQLTMQEGANISLSVAENGGNSTITISSTDTNTDEKVKVSSSDTADFLESQIVGGTGVNVSSDGSQITISAPPVNVEDSADGVEITFAGETSSALDINGTNLFIGSTDPTVTLGGQARNVLSKVTIPNTTPTLQQVIVDLPFSQIGGNYRLKLSNTQGFSEGLISLSGIGNDSFTKLLLHFDENFTDSAEGASQQNTASLNGSPTTGTTSTLPHPHTTASNVAAFDGNNESIDFPDSDDWDFGSGDFTVDLWVKPSSFSTSSGLVSQWFDLNLSGRASFLFYLFETTGEVRFIVKFENGGFVQFDTGITLDLNQWQHLAIVRNGTELSLFKDGTKTVLDNLFNETVALSNEPLVIGDKSGGGIPFNGELEEVRISKGIARFTGIFTPPTAPYN